MNSKRIKHLRTFLWKIANEIDSINDIYSRVYLFAKIQGFANGLHLSKDKEEREVFQLSATIVKQMTSELKNSVLCNNR